MSTPRVSNRQQSWSFGFKPTKKLPKPMTTHHSQSYHSLPREFFSQLIKLEADFHNKSYTLETLNQLTQYYAQAVEHYDNFKDEISSYFMYKIQDILATQKSLRMLTSHNKSFEDKENRIPGSNCSSGKKDISIRNTTLDCLNSSRKEFREGHIIEESSEDDDEKERNELERKRMTKKQDTGNRASISVLRNQKQRFVHLFYKIENEIGNEKENMHVALDSFSNSKEKNDNYIKNDIDQQKQKLRQRLDQRKQETFMSQTVNTQSFMSNRRTPFSLDINSGRKEPNGTTLEFMLNALDDGDELDYRKFISKPESVVGEFTPANLSIHEGYELRSPTENNIENISITKEIVENDLKLTRENNKEKMMNVEAIEVKANGDIGTNTSDTEKTSTEKDTSSDKEDSIGEKPQKE